jgi:DNA-binding XRE family transcriptional regulator
MTPTEYRQHRKAMDLTQDQLAKRLGLNKVTISNRERGDAIPVEAQLAMQSLLAETQPEKRTLGVITGIEKIVVNAEIRHRISVTLSPHWSYAILGRLVEVNAQPDVERSSDAS